MTTYALGRNKEHDERSRAFRISRASAYVGTALHKHHGGILDQGNVGACTGYAMAQCLMTLPFWKTRRYLHNPTALRFYKGATQRDDVDGTYPPDDTGSSGLAVCKAAKDFGYISGYEWAFGVDDAMHAIQDRPFLAGTVWYESMFEPDHSGVVVAQGEVAGGHEYLCLGFDATARRFAFLNSWSKDWGVANADLRCYGGVFYMDTSTFADLLEQDGDVKTPVHV